MAKKNVEVAATLIIPGILDEYYLLRPQPANRDSWMTDDMQMFYVATDGQVARHIVVKGPFLVDYATAGRIIEIKIEELEDGLTLEEEILHHPEVSEWLESKSAIKA